MLTTTVLLGGFEPLWARYARRFVPVIRASNARLIFSISTLHLEPGHAMQWNNQLSLPSLVTFRFRNVTAPTVNCVPYQAACATNSIPTPHEQIISSAGIYWYSPKIMLWLLATSQLSSRYIVCNDSISAIAPVYWAISSHWPEISASCRRLHASILSCPEMAIQNLCPII